MRNTFKIIGLDKNKKNINKFEKKISYGIERLEIDPSCYGNGVKIAIIDTGTPEHDAIINNIESSSNMINYNENKKDVNGHATMLSGVIVANDDSIEGLSPKAKLMFAKISDSSGECSYNSLIAGILWSIASRADVILIASGFKNNSTVIHNAIRKAYENNIPIISACDEERDLVYPADYKEVFNVCKHKQYNKFMKKYKYKTTYLKNKYTIATGSSMAAAITAGAAAIIIESKKKKNENIEVNKLYKLLEEKEWHIYSERKR